MAANSDFATAFESARKLHAAGKFAEAEMAYRRIANDAANRETVLQALFDLYVHAGRPQQAAETLMELIKLVPDSLTYHAHLGQLLVRMGQPEVAIVFYERLLERRPGFADAWFSTALMYKHALRYDDALAAYEKSIELGIDNEQEVWSNLGVLYSEMRNVDKAREMYEQALEIDSNYVPALFNLAGLHEETGERQAAVELYERILAAEPRHWDSLARLAQARKVTDADDPIIEQLEAGTRAAAGDLLQQEGLFFALGNVMDSLGNYKDAFTAYTSANELGKRRSQPYDAQVTAQAIDELIHLFDRDWIEQHATASKASPIFICGMFRSGSTLVEQMLGAHPEITSGGELEFLLWLIKRNLAPYPQRVTEVSAAELEPLSDEYVRLTAQLFPDVRNVTDKRPDNFLHLGLVKALFPQSRIVYTKRSKPDNCLSVYFQQLGGLNYATGLDTTADYYDQHVRLMDHWMACFGDSIHTVEYEEVVRSPEPVLRALLEYLGLPWDDRCLDFTRSSAAVKTASVWQVREGLHQASSGRWTNYADYAPQLSSM